MLPWMFRRQKTGSVVCASCGSLVGVVWIAGHAVREAEDGAAMALYERLKSFAVPVAGQRDGVGVRLRHPIA